MPRLPPSLFRRARAISPQAPALLPACRDLQSTAQELRWIREHVEATASLVPPGLRLARLCRRRGKGVPLQYVLGTQPFGDLDILCRPGVLIPRPETEAYTTALADLLLARQASAQRQGKAARQLRILDLCTGTGCIAQQLYARLAGAYAQLHVLGVDVSPRAVALAQTNLRRGLRTSRVPAPSAQQSVRFAQADIFSSAAWCAQVAASGTAGFDVLVCNPPYVSERGFAHDTARSVRNYEPRSALVPQSCGGAPSAPAAFLAGLHPHWRPEDVFYARLLDIVNDQDVAMLLFEVADLAQAVRVVRGILTSAGRNRRVEWHAEIWRDWPGDVSRAPTSHESVRIGERNILVRGDGEGRCVFATRTMC